MGRYHELKALKDKYAREILAIEGVHAVGIRVLENKIVVYCNDIEPLTLLSIPTELETVIVDAMGSPGNAIPTTWNEETPIPMNNAQGGQYKYRPFPAGVGIGHYLISVGTVGIPLWSRRLNKPVMVSNNHVLADATSTDSFGMIHCRKRQYTNSKQITISGGGTPYTGSGLVETVTNTTKFTWDFNKPIFTGISPTTAQAGDIVTITGKSLGFRMGYSKVWFGNVQAKVKSWVSTSNNMTQRWNYDYSIPPPHYDDWSLDTDSIIEVYVPDGITGEVEIKVEVEGDPIVQPARFDGGTLLDQVGQLEDYEPLVPFQPEVPYTSLGSYSNPNIAQGDVAIFSFVDDNYFANKVVAHGGRYIGLGYGFGDLNRAFVGSTYFDNGREYFVNGVQEEFCEKMPMMKIGRTTGTTFSIIYDPSYTVSFSYPGYGATPEPINDCVVFYQNKCTQMFDEELGYEYLADPVWGGDSGSSCFIASREDYFAYMNYYNLYHASETGTNFNMTNADFDAVEEIVPIEPMNWIGNIFSKISMNNPIDEFYSASDKGINWVGTFDVWPLGLENPFMQIPTTTSSNHVTTIVEIDTSVYLNLAEVNATAEIDCWVEGTRWVDLALGVVNATSETTVTAIITTGGSQQINIGNINLTPAVIQPSNNIVIDLVFFGNIEACYVSGTVEGNASVTCSVTVFLNAQGNADSVASVSMLLTLLGVGWTYDPWVETVKFKVNITRELNNNISITSKLEKEVQL